MSPAIASCLHQPQSSVVNGAANFHSVSKDATFLFAGVVSTLDARLIFTAVEFILATSIITVFIVDWNRTVHNTLALQHEEGRHLAAIIRLQCVELILIAVMNHVHVVDDLATHLGNTLGILFLSAIQFAEKSVALLLQLNDPIGCELGCHLTIVLHAAVTLSTTRSTIVGLTEIMTFVSRSGSIVEVLGTEVTTTRR